VFELAAGVALPPARGLAAGGRCGGYYAAHFRSQMMRESSALLTDLYQLTMTHAYFEQDMRGPAVFELYVRRLPSARRFLIAAGLERALEWLEGLRFEAAELEYLRSLGSFPEAFLEHLAGLRFTGTVHAMREGTPFFANEPVLRVTAPLIEAQLVESRLLNIVHFQTLIASKAARCVIAGRGRRLIDFGLRRAHEAEAGLLAARAAYLAGFEGTATVEAGRRFGIPLSGTLAHSFIEAHDSEVAAFRHFLASRPRDAVLLIDTYDTRRAAQRVAALQGELEAQGLGRPIRAVRIDSGELCEETVAVRRILDAHGAADIGIIVSGGLDEQLIESLLRGGAPIDAFGVGTSLDVSADAPALDMAYKLQMYDGLPRRKRSPGKATWPGAKQVLRRRGARGEALEDEVVLEGERTEGVPLLEEVMREGRRLGPPRPLGEQRAYCARELSSLPPLVRDLAGGDPAQAFPVRVSQALRELATQADARLEPQRT
jgi:nicotinate phosphoribosyltransferase